ncbi:MAG: flagellar basal body P-ring formation chaperone FlgA, partial [Planctomycetota bacterium]
VMACPPVRPGPVELGADLAEAELRVGVQSVRVRVMQNGRRAAEAMARVKVRVTGTLTVAAERLSAGDVLTESGYRTIRREFTANDLRARCDPRKLVGMVAKRNIAPDEPLTKALFALPQVIKRGEAVTVLVKRGALELTTQGEARNDAALDDPVRVFLVDSHSEIVARASGARQATLDDPLAGRQK